MPGESSLARDSRMESRLSSLAGDFLYGTELEALPQRFALHSAALRLRQPVTGEEIALSSPLPAALSALLIAK